MMLATSLRPDGFLLLRNHDVGHFHRGLIAPQRAELVSAAPGTPPAATHGMSNDLSAWNDVQRLADELEVQIHLAGMNARDRWRELEPRLEKLEQQIVHSGERTAKTVVHDLRDALREVRDDVYARARDDFNRGW